MIEYLFVALCLSLWMCRSTENKILCFVLIFWLFSQPVFNKIAIVSFSWLPFVMNLNRLLFVFLFFYWIFSKKKKDFKEVGPSVVAPLLVCIIFIGVSFLDNLHNVNLKGVLAVFADIVAFVLVYVVVKCRVTPLMRDAVIKALLWVAVLSSLIAILQFFHDSNFIRTGGMREAFGGRFRSTGIFYGEYELGYLMLLSVFMVVSKNLNVLLKLIIIGLLVVGLLLTFHRLSWLIFCVGVVVYVLYATKGRKRFAAVVGVGGLVLLVVLMVVALWGGLSKTDLVQDRLSKNTVTGRLNQYRLVTNMIVRRPLGIGSYDDPEYIRLMKLNGMTVFERDERGGGTESALVVHNGYLEFCLLYGLPAFGCLAYLLMNCLFFFFKQFKIAPRLYTVPFYSIVVLVLGNISNSFISFKFYYVLLVSMLMALYTFKDNSEKQGNND